jgi:hypothetical protein
LKFVLKTGNKILLNVRARFSRGGRRKRTGSQRKREKSEEEREIGSYGFRIGLTFRLFFARVTIAGGSQRTEVAAAGMPVGALRI